MSVLVFLVIAAIATSVEEAVDRRRERAMWARRRARRYTFN